MEKAKKAALKDLSAKQERIAALQQQVAGLAVDRERCQEVVKRGVVDKARIQQLQQQRDDEIAQAFLDKRDPQLTSIDSSIAEEQAAAAKALEDADAAKLALALIERQFTGLKDDIASAKDEFKQSVIAEMESRESALMADYLQAVESIGKIMIDMVSTNRVMMIFGKEQNANGFLPAQYLFDRLENERLPIPWAYSKRPYPGAGFTVPGQHQELMATPEWIIQKHRLITEASANLMGELADAGVKPI